MKDIKEQQTSDVNIFKSPPMFTAKTVKQSAKFNDSGTRVLSGSKELLNVEKNSHLSAKNVDSQHMIQENSGNSPTEGSSNDLNGSRGRSKYDCVEESKGPAISEKFRHNRECEDNSTYLGDDQSGGKEKDTIIHKSSSSSDLPRKPEKETAEIDENFQKPSNRIRTDELVATGLKNRCHPENLQSGPRGSFVEECLSNKQQGMCKLRNSQLDELSFENLNKEKKNKINVQDKRNEQLQMSNTSR